jgi:hypothetical protein
MFYPVSVSDGITFAAAFTMDGDICTAEVVSKLGSQEEGVSMSSRPTYLL